MTYDKDNVSYEVSSVAYGGEIVNVNGTSITDCGGCYGVFFEGDEVMFPTFAEAYAFATER